MRFVLTTNLQEFAERTQGLLAERIECNVQATVLENLLASRFADARPVLVYGLGSDGDVRFAALRTPPWPLLVTELEPWDAASFVAAWLDADPEVPAVSAVPETAKSIAAAWSELTGGSSRCRLREAMHVLDRVDDPLRSAPGDLRAARRDERELLIEWMRGFAEESGVIGGDHAPEIVDAQLAGGRLFLWDDRGAVSLLGMSPAVSGVVRIGLVYTPPEHRRRGYATSMVAAASRRALADGAARCMLYTDLANPTSNKIYAEVGYRRVGD